MKGGLSVNDKDMASIRKAIKDLEKISKQELSNELVYTASHAVFGMKSDVVVDNGNLRNSINYERVNGNQVAIYARAPYAPYVEFGTGRSVKFDDLIKLGFDPTYAQQFKGKGIKDINLPARPFFFVNVRKEFNKMYDRLQAKIKKLT
jgi:phage gpG-like protein